ARNVFDYTYDGAGNWPFNTAYASRYGLQGFVTRLRSLTEAEEFIRAGIPLVISVSFAKGDLDGAGYGTNGHLMVVVGFTESGDVVVNDPASHLVKDDGQVRTTYRRDQLENAWVPHSGGTVYVIHPEKRHLPKALTKDEPNW
ncbi:MAG: C39 family peptidase, partial [Nocardioidaceae bacterium]